MKKANLIGALLAAVIAAAPATGLTGNVLSFNDNAIVAEAASSASMVVSNGKNVYFKMWGQNCERIILQNDIWELVSNSNGDLFSRCRKGNGRKSFFNNPYTKYSIYPGTNKPIVNQNGNMNYSVLLQSDGNLVAYLNDANHNPQYDLPLWHTNSWTGAPKTVKYRNQKVKEFYNLVKKYSNVYSVSVTEAKYELTSDGDLIIYAHYKCKCYNYQYGEAWCKVWDSSKDTLDRIV